MAHRWTQERPESRRWPLKLADMEVRVDPRAEWKQMYHEVWRIERDFLYDPHFHGLDLGEAREVLCSLLTEYLQPERSELSVQEMLGNMTVGHMFIGGGRDLAVRNVKRRAAWRRLQDREWTISLRQGVQRRKLEPTTAGASYAPGVNINAGEYLLAVNGRDVHSSDRCLQLLRGDCRQADRAQGRSES